MMGREFPPAGRSTARRAVRGGPPSASLYVNDYNERAVRTYEAVGFERVGTFATIMM